MTWAASPALINRWPSELMRWPLADQANHAVPR
jgi:hypothetical protein